MPECKTYWGDQRAPNVCDHRPVEREDTHAEPRYCPEELIDDDIIGCDPANPIKHAEPSEKITRYPVPEKAAPQNDAKEFFPRHVAPVGLAVALVQGVEQRTVNESSRPDHARRPDEESAQ